MKAHRRTVTAVVALVAVVGAGVIALAVARQSSPVEIPENGPWVIVVGTGAGAYEECVDDPAVDFYLSTADLPSTGSAVYLLPDALRADVKRVADCIVRHVSSGQVAVTKRAGAS